MGGVLVRLGRQRSLRLDIASGRREILLQPCCALPFLLQGFSLHRAAFRRLPQLGRVVVRLRCQRRLRLDIASRRREILLQPLCSLPFLLQRFSQLRRAAFRRLLQLGRVVARLRCQRLLHLHIASRRREILLQPVRLLLQRFSQLGILSVRHLVGSSRFGRRLVQRQQHLEQLRPAVFLFQRLPQLLRIACSCLR